MFPIFAMEDEGCTGVPNMNISLAEDLVFGSNYLFHACVLREEKKAAYSRVSISISRGRKKDRYMVQASTSSFFTGNEIHYELSRRHVNTPLGQSEKHGINMHTGS